MKPAPSRKPVQTQKPPLKPILKKKPQWDDTTHDLSQFKLTPEEKKRREKAAMKCTPSPANARKVMAGHTPMPQKVDWTKMKGILADVLQKASIEEKENRIRVDQDSFASGVQLEQPEVDFTEELDQYLAKTESNKRPMKRVSASLVAQPTKVRNEPVDKKRVLKLYSAVQKYFSLVNYDASFPAVAPQEPSLDEVMDLLTIQIETASYIFTKDELDKDKRVKKLNEIDSRLNELSDQVDEILSDFEALKATVKQQEQQLASISDSTGSVLDLLKQLGERVDILEEFNNDQAMAKSIRNFLLDSSTSK